MAVEVDAISETQLHFDYRTRTLFQPLESPLENIKAVVRGCFMQ
jgi:hypothetical protein